MLALSHLVPGDLLLFPNGLHVLRIEEFFSDGNIGVSICPRSSPAHTLESAEWSIDQIIGEKLVPCNVAHDGSLAIRYVN